MPTPSADLAQLLNTPWVQQHQGRLLPVGDFQALWWEWQDAAWADAEEGEAVDDDLDEDDDEDGEEDDEDDHDLLSFLPDDATVLLLRGTVTLDQAQRAQMAQAGVAVLAVQGDLHSNDVQLSIWDGLRAFYVQGDLHMASLTLTADAEAVQVLGTVHCPLLLDYAAEDDGMTRPSRLGRVQTPLAFLWFVRSDAPLELPDDTVVFMLSGWEYCEERVHSSAQPMLIWHEAIYALRDELYGTPEADWHDASEWRIDEIKQALRQGEPIWRDGFDPRALAPWRQGVALAQAGEPAAAWQALREAVRLAPGFSPALSLLGELMVNAGAMAQALPWLRHAHAWFPKHQTAFQDRSAYPLVLCALYLGHTDEARLAAEAELARLAPGNATQDARGQMQRALLEVALVQGQLAEARGLLHDLDGTAWSQRGSVLWLRGRWHWLQADQPLQDRAEQLRLADAALQKAVAASAAFELPYASHTQLRAVLPPECTVDWPERVADPSLAQAVQVKLVAQDAHAIGQVPPDARNGALLQALSHACPASASTWLLGFHATVRAAEVDAELAARLVRANANVLGTLPRALITRELCLQAQPWTDPDDGRQWFDAAAVPAGVWDEAVALRAIACGALSKDIPQAVITPAVAEAMVRAHPYAISDVPLALQTDALWALAAASDSSPYFLANQVPWRLSHSADFLRAVIAVRYEALDCVPGPRFDAALFAHAQGLYGERANWPDTVRRHQLPWLHEHDADVADGWWRVFWTEADVLACVQAEQLHPYEIPADAYTQAIADACYAQHGNTWLNDVPERFVTDAQYQAWLADEYHAKELTAVPIARRDAALCAVAVRAGAPWDAVPAAVLLPTTERLMAAGGWAPDTRVAQTLADRLAQGSAYVAARALAAAKEGASDDDVDNDDSEDAAIDAAITQAGWLLPHLQALLLPPAPQTAAAQAIARTLLQATDALGDAPTDTALGSSWAARLWSLRRGARFWLGYALWLQGDAAARAEAATLRAASDLDPLPAYADFDPAAQQARSDLDRNAFGGCMAEAEKTEDPAAVWQAALRARQLLEAAGSHEPALWAHVLDKQRWASLALQAFDDNRRACEEMVQRLSGLQLMAFDAQDRGIAQMLGAAHHRLGARLLDGAEDANGVPPTPVELLAAWQQHERALALLRTPYAAGEQLAGYWDSRLRILRRLADAGGPQAERWSARLKHETEKVYSLPGYPDWYWSDEGRALIKG